MAKCAPQRRRVWLMPSDTGTTAKSSASGCAKQKQHGGCHAARAGARNEKSRATHVAWLNGGGADGIRTHGPGSGLTRFRRSNIPCNTSGVAERHTYLPGRCTEGTYPSAPWFPAMMQYQVLIHLILLAHPFQATSRHFIHHIARLGNVRRAMAGQNNRFTLGLLLLKQPVNVPYTVLVQPVEGLVQD